MKRITIKYSAAATALDGRPLTGTEEWACNGSGEGIFSRRSDGTWQQLAGTGQAGPFRTPAQLRAALRTRYDVRGARIVDSTGW